MLLFSLRSASDSSNNCYNVYIVYLMHTKYMMLPISGEMNSETFRMCNISNIGNKICMMFTK